MPSKLLAVYYTYTVSYYAGNLKKNIAEKFLAMCYGSIASLPPYRMPIYNLKKAFHKSPKYFVLKQPAPPNTNSVED